MAQPINKNQTTLPKHINYVFSITLVATHSLVPPSLRYFVPDQQPPPVHHLSSKFSTISDDHTPKIKTQFFTSYTPSLCFLEMDEQELQLLAKNRIEIVGYISTKNEVTVYEAIDCGMYGGC
jgi:hypothetical protein